MDPVLTVLVWLLGFLSAINMVATYGVARWAYRLHKSQPPRE